MCYRSRVVARTDLKLNNDIFSKIESLQRVEAVGILAMNALICILKRTEVFQTLDTYLFASRFFFVELYRL